MRLILFKKECWIKDDIPPNFNSMNEYEKWDYINNNNLFHREDGPAIITFLGVEYWCFNGKTHRLDGPAIIYSDFHKFWYLDNIKVDGRTYKKIQSSSKEKLLVYMIDSEYKDYLPLIEYRLSL